MSQHIFTIPINGTESNEVSVNGRSLCLWSLPAMTGTSLALQHKNEAGVWTALLDADDVAVTIVVGAAAKQKVLSPTKTFLCRTVRLVSNGTEVAERTIYAYGDSFQS